MVVFSQECANATIQLRAAHETANTSWFVRFFGNAEQASCRCRRGFTRSTFGRPVGFAVTKAQDTIESTRLAGLRSTDKPDPIMSALDQALDFVKPRQVVIGNVCIAPENWNLLPGIFQYTGKHIVKIDDFARHQSAFIFA